jgi:hypothetical protein
MYCVTQISDIILNKNYNELGNMGRPSPAKKYEERIRTSDVHVTHNYLQYDGSLGKKVALFRGHGDTDQALAGYARYLIGIRNRGGSNIIREAATQVVGETQDPVHFYYVEEKTSSTSSFAIRIADIKSTCNEIQPYENGQEVVKYSFAPIADERYPPNNLANYQTVTLEGEAYTSVIPPMNTALGVVLVIVVLFFILLVLAMIGSQVLYRNTDWNKLKSKAQQSTVVVPE